MKLLYPSAGVQVNDLRKELESRSLSSKGLKSQLIARLTKQIKLEEQQEETKEPEKPEVPPPEEEDTARQEDDHEVRASPFNGSKDHKRSTKSLCFLCHKIDTHK